MSQLMPPGWTAHQTGDGRWYYAHGPSGTTQWKPPPPDYSIPPPPSKHHGGKNHASSSKYHSSKIKKGKYVYNHPIEFKLKEKALSLSGDAFSVKRTDTKQNVFKVKGNAFSLKDSKTLSSASGTSIFKMNEAIFSLRGRMHIYDARSKKPVVTLRKKSYLAITGYGGGGILVWKGGSDDGEPYLKVKGDFFKKDFTIQEVATGDVVASVKRKGFNISNILFEKDTYIIRIEPGQDAALLVFLVVAIDEQYRDDGDRRGYGSLF